MPISAASPRWVNTEEIITTLDDVNGKPTCTIIITGFSGTSKIDNINITIYRISNNVMFLVDEWKNMSVNSSVFEFSETVDNAISGYTYQINIKASVHRNGVTEKLDQNVNIKY